MRQQTRLVVNALVNTLARFVTIGTRFVIVPFAVSAVGRSHYGAWIIVGQILGYTRILEMGLRSAVGRQVAMRLARNEHGPLGRYVNTAFAHYLMAGLIIATLTVIVSVFFADWFEIEPEYRTATQAMVLCAGFSLALSIPQYAYEGILAGLQRFDIIAGTHIGADLLRMAVILLLLKQFEVGGGLVILAIASGGSALIGMSVRTVVSSRLYPQGRYAPWRAERALWWPIASFGFDTVVYMMSAMVAAQLAQIVIGAMISTAAATDFRLAMELILAGHAFVIACTVGIRPAASRYDGEDNSRMLRHLLIRSTRYAALVSLFGLLVLLVFSGGLLRLWQGMNYPGPEGQATLERIAATCRVLAVGYGLFWLLLPAYNVVNGMGRHRFPAVVAVVSGVVSMVLVVLLALGSNAGITRIAWGVIVPMIPVWGGHGGVLHPRDWRAGLEIPMAGVRAARGVVPTRRRRRGALESLVSSVELVDAASGVDVFGGDSRPVRVVARGGSR